MELASDNSKLNTGLNAAKAQITEFHGKANSLLATVGIGLSVAGGAKLLADMAQKGSDLGETMNKVKEVFKGSAGVVNTMADDMAMKFGAVRGVTLDAAANLGLVAQGAKMSAKESAELAVKLTRLADDASSFYNVPLEVALEKIRSGLVGEAEPLRAFGVLLSEDAVKAKAAAMGIKAVGGELSEQEKVMARVQLITEGLNKATGDHERTLGSYANQLRRLKGELANWEADIGAPIAGGLSMVMQSIRERGIFATIGRADWQQEADKAAGVKVGLPGPNILPPGTGRKVFGDAATKWWSAFTRAAESSAYKQGEKYDAPGAALGNLTGFAGGFNLSDFVGRMNQLNKGPSLDEQIATQRKQMSAWGGGHVMDTESFMKSAQEKILQPKDVMAEKQLAELIKARENLDKLVGKTNAPAKPGGGMVLRGREI